jgi:hypothetical protein
MLSVCNIDQSDMLIGGTSSLQKCLQRGHGWNMAATDNQRRDTNTHAEDPALIFRSIIALSRKGEG